MIEAFAWKMDKDVNVIKPKAGLIARGVSQVHTVDFEETPLCSYSGSIQC